MNRRIKLGNFEYSDETTAFVIAEVGHNHQGNLETALQLIRAAAYAGASAVKFQKRDNRRLFTPSAFDAPYTSENAYAATYGLHREALEFGREEYLACIAEANRCGILFFSTAFDFESADFLESLDMPIYKVASGDLKTIPLIRHIAKKGKPMILSTGGASIEDVDLAVNTVLELGTPLALLQCTAGYPPKYEELNLRVIETFRSRYPEVVIGYSGHDNGIAMSLGAYVLGARVIEKHFTLDRTLRGTDHAFSLEPQGMQKLVRDISRVHIALGDGVKQPYESEAAPLRKMGKMIVAATDLKASHVIREEDLEYRSPWDGLAPSQLDSVLGKSLISPVRAFEAIQVENLK